MDPLRWTLLVIGLALIAGVWYHGRRNRPAHEESLFERARRQGGDDDRVPVAADDHAAEAPPADFDPARFQGPVPDVDLELDPQELDELLTEPRDRPVAEPSPGDASGDAGARPPAGSRQRPGRRATEEGEERIVVLYVMAAGDERIDGARLRQAFARQHLEHGQYEIFHRFAGDGRAVFSVASMVEPGTFEPERMDEMTTPGVALFARLPGPVAATDAFDEMVATARMLAEELEGRALDGRHSTLTRQTEHALRDELLEYEHRRSRDQR